MSITFTLDLEDHLDVYDPSGRWVRNTKTLLGFCRAKNIRGTFFTVGRAAVAPDLLKQIVNEGHELALHSYDHIPLIREDEKTYSEKLGAAKKTFEAITGKKVEGFRAPVFSLTPKSRWAVDVLSELGFAYSSSIIAGKSAFAGYPGAPDVPFTWPTGLIEIPVPALRIGAGALPFLGGVYLRYLPLALVKSFVVAELRSFEKASPRNLETSPLLWTYLHPYDIDHDEGFVKFNDGTPLWANVLLMNNRKGFLNKIGALLDHNSAPPFIERIKTLNRLPVFEG